MGATLYDVILSESQESNSSCNSFLDGAFVDDAPAKRKPRCSRSYYCNRFSSHALVIMLAVYLLLLGALSTATETNQTIAASINPAENLVLTAKHDIDNEITANLDENPAIVEKESFSETSLTENLEDTIRSSVKSEIELEQNVGSPALLNALNVMPETENIVLVEHAGGTTHAPKHEPPTESNTETQCDASSLVCLRVNKKEPSPTTPVNIIASPVAESNETEILASSTAVPIAVKAIPTAQPESNIPPKIEEGLSQIVEQAPQTSQQGVREGRMLESKSISQNEEPIQDLDSTPSESTASLNNEENAEPLVENKSNSNIKLLNVEEAESDPGNALQSNEQQIETKSEENANLSEETKVINEPANASHNNEENVDKTDSTAKNSPGEIEPISEPVVQNTYNQVGQTVSSSTTDSSSSSTESVSNQHDSTVAEQETAVSNHAIEEIGNNDNLNETKPNLAVAAPQNEAQVASVEASNNASESIEQAAEKSEQSPVNTETQNSSNEPVKSVENIPSQTPAGSEAENAPNQPVEQIENISTKALGSNEENSDVIETQTASPENQDISNQTDSANNSPAPTANQVKPETPAIELEGDISPPESLDSDGVNDIANEAVISENVAQEIEATTAPSSESAVKQHSSVNVVNDTLSIIFEEPLTATELPVPQVDDYIKTIIDMEDPLMSETQVDQTTVQPEQAVHNVIKKQGVEPIEIEQPITVVESEPDSTTLPPNAGSLQPIQPITEVESSPPVTGTINIVSEPDLTTDLPSETITHDITEVSVVFPGKGDDDAVLNGKGSRSINALHSPLTGHHKASINFDVYPAGQTFNQNLADEMSDDIGKALPTHRLSEQDSNRSTLIIALCSGTAVLFIVISVTIFMVSFQRQHGTLDIEMQERRDNVNDDDAETCVKLLDIELPNNSLILQTEAEAEIEECL